MIDVGEHGDRQEIAVRVFAAETCTAGDQARAVALRGLDNADDALHRSLADDRSHDRRTIEWIADLDVRPDAGQPLQLLLVDRTLEQQQRAVDPTLPARTPPPPPTDPPRPVAPDTRRPQDSNP